MPKFNFDDTETSGIWWSTNVSIRDLCVELKEDTSCDDSEIVEFLRSISESIDVNQLLVKFSILEGELNKVYLESTDPKSPDGEKITGLEKKKIFEAIKLIEDKILKIKLAIDKNK